MSHKEMHCLWDYMYAHFLIGSCSSIWSLKPVEQLVVAKMSELGRESPVVKNEGYDNKTLEKKK